MPWSTNRALRTIAIAVSGARAPSEVCAQSPPHYRPAPAPLAYTIDNPYRVYWLRGTDTVGPAQHERTVESHAWRGTERQPEVVIRQLTLDVNRRTTTDTFTIAPPVAPDTLPRALLQSLGYVRAEPSGRRYVRDVVIVAFRPGTPQSDRQEIVDRIHGNVIGGVRGPYGDGDYYVRIRGGTYAAILRALRTMRSAAQVSYAAHLPYDQEPPTR